MRRGGIGRCDTYYDLLESHGRTDRGSKIEGRLTVRWGMGLESGFGGLSLALPYSFIGGEKISLNIDNGICKMKTSG